MSLPAQMPASLGAFNASMPFMAREMSPISTATHRSDSQDPSFASRGGGCASVLNSTDHPRPPSPHSRVFKRRRRDRPDFATECQRPSREPQPCVQCAQVGQGEECGRNRRTIGCRRCNAHRLSCSFRAGLAAVSSPVMPTPAAWSDQHPVDAMLVHVRLLTETMEDVERKFEDVHRMSATFDEFRREWRKEVEGLHGEISALYNLVRTVASTINAPPAPPLRSARLHVGAASAENHGAPGSPSQVSKPQPKYSDTAPTPCFHEYGENRSPRQLGPPPGTPEVMSPNQSGRGALPGIGRFLWSLLAQLNPCVAAVGATPGKLAAAPMTLLVGEAQSIRTQGPICYPYAIAVHLWPFWPSQTPMSVHLSICPPSESRLIDISLPTMPYTNVPPSRLHLYAPYSNPPVDDHVVRARLDFPEVLPWSGEELEELEAWRFHRRQEEATVLASRAPRQEDETEPSELNEVLSTAHESGVNYWVLQDTSLDSPRIDLNAWGEPTGGNWGSPQASASDIWSSPEPECVRGMGIVRTPAAAPGGAPMRPRFAVRFTGYSIAHSEGPGEWDYVDELVVDWPSSPVDSASWPSPAPPWRLSIYSLPFRTRDVYAELRRIMTFFGQAHPEEDAGWLQNRWEGIIDALDRHTSAHNYDPEVAMQHVLEFCRSHLPPDAWEGAPYPSWG
ncbi:hypothetical protein K466DRAFT_568411 [Polyporus arcularius HHB13444]|uniref:Zn(2)-C6 fungal-type domain-containing protein n=1 Tax=Polyporus arcularius HHB13444 TaxID=1314778 RepID=A0A5C3P0X3_9APHY|nr:hypothetical protein K466DRAFT_568411 [Polyporus arcularius HHB13444]